MMLAMDEAVGTRPQETRRQRAGKKHPGLVHQRQWRPYDARHHPQRLAQRPLRGTKRTTLEGGIRVPFVVAWPGRLTPGIYQQPAIQLDLTATALAAAGVGGFASSFQN